ncbi:DnaB-like helicase N-terminal domain-containing protein [Streptomyces sp. CT34]|uniref:DnaB-like helicase N-terminal domain-containing protein n=1 Tax=Streptomyces sp. CT34 TaxID=1553907 RepID=UPI0005BAE555|nr:DnaB-like helicase N-terminal domain-containing protein [Streptomyces sp. CT34]
MPRTPDPDEDDLDALPPVHFAEQALLGALLLEPHRLDEVPPIDPDCFSTAAHSALFAAIRSLPAPDPAQHTQNTDWLEKVLTTAQDHVRGLSASYLHTVIQVCPRPRHAPAYARMIEAEHARRTLRAGAQRLAQTARDLTHPQPVPTTLAEADALTAIVDHLAATFPPHPGSLPRTPAPTPAAPHNGDEAAEEERLLLAAATAHPRDVEQMRWLTAGDFTRPLHGGLWQSATALAQRHAPVDPVTILWEAQQRGLLTADTEPAELLDLLGAPAVGSPHYWGERVLQHSLLATAHHVALRIEAFTDDPATTPYQLVVGSRRALADLAAVRTRWHHATSPAPAPTHQPTRASAPPRAGPPRTTAPSPSRISR